MRRCAPTGHGAGRLYLHQRGFTLLEMCIVLVIMALLAGVTMPAVQSALVESYVRNDAHQLSLLVKTAMLQSAEQNRAYVIELTPTTMSLHPADEASNDGVSSSASDDDTTSSNPNPGLNVTYQLDTSNKVLLPDPEKPKAWAPLDKAVWVFRPADLCPVPRVRLDRGGAWLEMSFNALTGDVEDETATFP